MCSHGWVSRFICISIIVSSIAFCHNSRIFFAGMGVFRLARLRPKLAPRQFHPHTMSLLYSYQECTSPLPYDIHFISLFPHMRSAYRRHHSTETVVLTVHNDIIQAIDRRQLTALVLLDLSSAFDTVDHTCLLTILQNRFSVDATVASWFQSYLSHSTQTFSAGRD